jgi:KDO2-lipid IV(A) lauroyltransferase
MRPFKKIKRTLVYLILRLFVWCFNIIPRSLAIYIGGWVGLAIWKLSFRDQHRAVRHLSLAYGDQLAHREKLAIGRGFFINSGRNLADVIRFKKHYQSEILPLIEAEGMEHFEAAFRKGKGLFGVTGHIGNFELLAAFMQSSGFEVAVIGRELYDPRLDRLLIENREAVGLTNISTTDSPKRILGWLKAGKTIGVLIDTDSHRIRGEFVPAFGRWSNTPVGQSILAVKTGAALVPTACLRTANNRYKIIVRPEIEIEPSGDTRTDVINATAACTRVLEEIVREHLDQWPWQHNRWRTKRQTSA